MIDLELILQLINKIDLSRHEKLSWAWVEEWEVRLGLFVKITIALEILASFKGRTVRDYDLMQWEFEFKFR